ncbi:MAG: 50S ribosomal protein L17 [bacterium]|nr:50S ribosomal protein L17 [bacterium]
MRHGNAFRKLGTSASHRRALLRNLATSLVLNNRIETTLPKAKELKRVADKLVTLGKRGDLHARRQAMSYLFEVKKTETGNVGKREAVHKLFEELAPRFSERAGGYTRVLRTRVRQGDGAQMAIIEFVEAAVQKKEVKKRRRVVRKSETAEVVAE